jgi:uncharacterized protein
MAVALAEFAEADKVLPQNLHNQMQDAVQLNRRNAMTLKRIRLLTAFSLLLVCSTSFASPSLADDMKTKEPVIIVSGDGEAAIAPDMAMLNFSVVRLEKSAKSALAANTKAMADVIAAMKNFAIEDRDLQTSGFSVDPQYDYPQNPDGTQQPPVLRGYQVVNALSVRVRDLGKIGEIIDTAVQLGVNQGGSIRFGNIDPKPALAEARISAMQDALAKAKALTEAAGVKLGRIIEISESGTQASPQPIMAMAAKSAMDSMSAPVPVEAGENTYRATVNVTIGLEQ